MSGPHWHVRLALPSDTPAWYRLAASLKDSVQPLLNPPRFAAVLSRCIAQHTALAACVGDSDAAQLAGGLLYRCVPQGPCRIGWLAVAAEFRRRGVAGLLLQSLYERCSPAREYRVVTFGPAHSGAPAARAFYRAMGFSPVQAVDHDAQREELKRLPHKWSG
jgi:GNAT superfamily N-acetyltransferase